MHHPLAPLGVLIEEEAERAQAAHDVLRQLRAVHADDHLAVRAAGLLPQRGEPLLDVGAARALPEEVRVRAEAVHPDLRTEGAAHHGLAARRERVRPAPRQEPEPVRAQHPAQQLPGDVVRQHPEVVDRRPRGVREVPDAQVVAQLPQHPRHERQVVVLHDDRGARPGLRGQRLGERPVVGLVRRPLRTEPWPEDRLQGRLVEHVVDEPEDRVRDAVVRVCVHLGGDVEHPHTRLSDATPHRLAVAFAEGRAHPHRARAVRVLSDRGEPGDEPAAAAPRVERPVGPELVRDRTAVGRDEDLCTLRGSHTGKRSPVRKRSNVWPDSVGARPYTIRRSPAATAIRAGQSRRLRAAATARTPSAHRAAARPPYRSVSESPVSASLLPCGRGDS